MKNYQQDLIIFLIVILLFFLIGWSFVEYTKPFAKKKETKDNIFKKFPSDEELKELEL